MKRNLFIINITRMTKHKNTLPTTYMHKMIKSLVTGCIIASSLTGCQQQATIEPASSSKTQTPIGSATDHSTLSTTATTAVPSGFYVVQSAPGVVLYRKDYTGGQPDYVQEINLAAGARLSFIQGSSNTGSCTTPSALFTKRPLHTSRSGLPSYWDSYRNTPYLFSLQNAQFFVDNGQNPTQLAYPIKEGSVFNVGYANNDSNRKRILKIYGSYAVISDYINPSNYCEPFFAVTNDASQAIVGHHPLPTDPANDPYKGQTYLGVKDGNGDGKPEVVYIFTSRYARQVDARQALLDFGTTWNMRLDSGGSTQMTCRGINYVVSTDATPRLIPSVLGVFSAP